MMHRVLAVLATACLLGGCAQQAQRMAAPGEAAAAEQVYAYTCDGAAPFRVRFEGDLAVLTLSDREARLPRVVSGSGARYSDGNVMLWIKGDDAMLEIRGECPAACRVAGRS